MELVRVPAGEFLMGSDPAKDLSALDGEKPQHRVPLAEFYIGRYEVTNAQYAAFVKATGHRAPDHWKNGSVPAGKEDHPIVDVSWDDAVAFTQWLGEDRPTRPSGAPKPSRRKPAGEPPVFSIPGVTRSMRATNTSATLVRQRQLVRTRPMATAPMAWPTWPATCGNG